MARPEMRRVETAIYRYCWRLLQRIQNSNEGAEKNGLQAQACLMGATEKLKKKRNT